MWFFSLRRPITYCNLAIFLIFLIFARTYEQDWGQQSVCWCPDLRRASLQHKEPIVSWGCRPAPTVMWWLRGSKVMCSEWWISVKEHFLFSQPASVHIRSLTRRTSLPSPRPGRRPRSSQTHMWSHFRLFTSSKQTCFSFDWSTASQPNRLRIG